VAQPISVSQLLSQAKGLLSQKCKTKFTNSFSGYTTDGLFSILSSATITQYPGGTSPQDSASYGADAVTNPTTQTIDLLPNFYGRDAKSQAYVLIHEGIHLLGRGTLGDATVQSKLGLPIDPNTDNITQYIAGGCKP
jgi:hypothetical protein